LDDVGKVLVGRDLPAHLRVLLRHTLRRSEHPAPAASTGRRHRITGSPGAPKPERMSVNVGWAKASRRPVYAQRERRGTHPAHTQESSANAPVSIARGAQRAPLRSDTLREPPTPALCVLWWAEALPRRGRTRPLPRDILSMRVVGACTWVIPNPVDSSSIVAGPPRTNSTKIAALHRRSRDCPLTRSFAQTMSDLQPDLVSGGHFSLWKPSSPTFSSCRAASILRSPWGCENKGGYLLTAILHCFGTKTTGGGPRDD
jgi:hypothetical protein